MNGEQATYKLTDSERRHIADVQTQMSALQQEILALEGTIRLKEREFGELRKHLQLYAGQLAADNGLMAMGARLSPDGSALVGQSNGG